jgi:ABC-2 type transport system permease protein
MLANVFLKTLRDQRRSGLAWTAGILAITAYATFLYPVIADQADLQRFIDALPEAIKAIAGGVLDYTTVNGFLSAQFFSIIGPIIFIVYAVLHGSGTIAGEEEHGTLGLLLAQPVSRRLVLLHKAAALLTGIGVGAAVLWAGLAAWSLAAGVDLGVGLAAQGAVSLALLGAFFAMLALAVGAATGRRSVSSGTAVAVGVASYLLNAFSPLVSWLEPVRLATPFYYYQGNEPVIRGLSLLHAGVLVAASAALLGYALWAFERRDLVR